MKEGLKKERQYLPCNLVLRTHHFLNSQRTKDLVVLLSSARRRHQRIHDKQPLLSVGGPKLFFTIISPPLSLCMLHNCVHCKQAQQAASIPLPPPTASAPSPTKYYYIQCCSCAPTSCCCCCRCPYPPLCNSQERSGESARGGNFSSHSLTYPHRALLLRSFEIEWTNGRALFCYLPIFECK